MVEAVITGTCPNPRCTCDPCLCGDDCRCGGGNLGELERRVMDVVWSAAGSEITARDVSDVLDEYAYTTIATVLNRLSRKGVVRRRMDGRTTKFAPLGTPADRAAAVMADALDASGDRDGALARFAGSMSAEDRAALLRALLPEDAVAGPAATTTAVPPP
jgi:predicted transcriptional regulator